MTIGEMLQELRENILHDRSDRVAGVDDHLWSDATLVNYIDEAIRRFAKRTLCIRDGSTDVTKFTSMPYQKEYPLDPTILAVLSVRGLGNGYWSNGQYLYPPDVVTQVPPDKADLARAGHANIDAYREPDTYFFNPDELSQLSPGKPLAFTTDEYTSADSSGSVGVVTLRLYPIPSPSYANIPYQMRVARMPSQHYTKANLDLIPEIPEDYHLNVLDYAAYLALRIVDHELGDPARAEQFRQSFEVHIVEAKDEMQKRQFQPNLWGFGHNGFSFVGN